ncbi:MAG: TonB-dependent receptor [Bacteroidales bacterium]|nr:TonB-dependent receptor [Bacteroidales bacterium]
MRKTVLVLILWQLSLFFPMGPAMAQNTSKSHTISGYVTDGKSQETLLGASVYDAATMKGSVTNNFGYYTLKLTDGQVDFRASFVGYDPYQARFELKNDTVINIALAQSNQLNEVTVTARAIESNVKGTQMSTIELPMMQMKKIPALFGETDVIKALQLLPGVQSGTEGSAGMYVRGGGPDENLILLDGVPLYNVNHAAGFFSAFNSDAIKNVTLYKGNFPARFGGRLSSVVDVRMKDGDMYEYHGNVSLGLIASKVNVEGPIIKGKTSFNLSFRRTYYDLITAPLANIMVKQDIHNGNASAWAGYYFYDLNLKVNHKFSDKDRLFLSIYSGDDKVYANIKYKDEYSNDYNGHVTGIEKLNLDWKWGNRIAALRWNHVIQPNLFMNVTGAYTQYRHFMGAGFSEESSSAHSSYSESMDLGVHSGIYDYSAKADFDYNPFENHDVKFGANLTFHTYSPTTTAVHLKETENNQTGYAFDSVSNDAKIRALETDLYIEDNWSINNFFKLNAGLHYSTFSVDHKTYHSLQPRLSLRALVTEDFSLKAGYAYMSQYIHLLSNNAISLPTDLWVPVTGNVIPMNAHQVALGAFYDWKGFEFSVEGYFKKLNNVMEYKDGSSFFSLDQTDWQDKVVMGDGWSYGIELFAQKQVGKFTGWVGYTWAHANRLFDRPGQELNFGEVFPAKYDRRHDLNIVLMYDVNDWIDLGATWIYSSGNCATLPLQGYHGLGDYAYYGYYDPTVINHIESRNNYRFNSYQRLDLVANFHEQKKHCERIFSINVYNTLCHNNPFVVIPREEEIYYPDLDEYKRIKVLKQICIFPIIPTLSWQYKW